MLFLNVILALPRSSIARFNPSFSFLMGLEWVHMQRNYHTLQRRVEESPAISLTGSRSRLRIDHHGLDQASRPFYYALIREHRSRFSTSPDWRPHRAWKTANTRSEVLTPAFGMRPICRSRVCLVLIIWAANFTIGEKNTQSLGNCGTYSLNLSIIISTTLTARHFNEGDNNPILFVCQKHCVRRQNWP